MLKKALVIKYEKEYKAGNIERANLIDKILSKYNVTTVYAIDCIYFIDCHNDNVIYCFEL